MIKQYIKDSEKEFEEEFCHKGEDGDDPEEEWEWTIIGSFPIEVLAWHRSQMEGLVKRMVSEIEGMKKELKTHVCFDISDRIECQNDKGEKICVHQALIDDYNQALEDLKAKLVESLKE